MFVHGILFRKVSTMLSLLLLSSSIVAIDSRFVTYITHTNVTYDSNVCNVSVNVNFAKNSSYDYGINADVYSYKEAPTLFASFKLFLYDSSGKAKPLLQNTVDVCRLFERGSYREKLVVYFFDLMKDSGRFAKRCPVKAGHYYIRNISLPTSIPMIQYFTTNGTGYLEYAHFTHLHQKTKRNYVFKVLIFGGYKHI